MPTPRPPSSLPVILRLIASSLIALAAPLATADVLFFDDFEDPGLTGGWIVSNPDPDTHRVGTSRLYSHYPSGTMEGDSTDWKNLFLVENPTTGDFRVTVKVRSYNVQFNLIAWDDHRNMVRLGVDDLGPEQRIFFGSETENLWTQISELTIPERVGGSWDLLWMRLEKSGTDYHASYSIDGSTFETFSDPLTFGDGSPMHIGLWVGANDFTELTPVLPGANIDWIRVDNGSTCATPDTTMVSWWRGESNDRDHLGLNHGTRLNGATYGAGRIGCGFSFDGIDDVVAIDSSGIFKGRKYVMIEAWVRPRGPHSNEGNLGGQIFGENTSVDNMTRFGLFALNDGRLQTITRADESGDPIVVTTSATIPNDQWSHVVALGGVGGSHIWINGERASIGFVGLGVPNLPETDSSFVSIGAGGSNPQNTSNSFNGEIDELSVYVDAPGTSDLFDLLDPGEIRGIYNAGESGKCLDTIVAPDGLYSTWRFDGHAADGLDRHHGTLENGAIAGAGFIRQGVHLNGAGAHVVVPDPTQTLDVEPQITLEGWVKFDSFPAGAVQVVASKGNLSGDLSYAIWYEAGSLHGRVDLINGATAGVSAPLADTTDFHHVALTYDGTNLALYVDGALAQATPLTGASVFDTEDPLYFGRHAGSGADGFGDSMHGILDDWSFYHRGLTEADVAAIHAAGPSGKTGGLWVDFSYKSGGGSWSDPTRWEPEGVPGPRDHVTIGTGTVFIDEPVKIADLTMFGGAIQGNESLNILHSATWVAGNLTGAHDINVETNAGFIITGASGRSLAGPRLNIHGALSWVGGVAIPLYNGSRINIFAGAEFWISNDQRFYDPGPGGQPKIINHGVIRKIDGDPDGSPRTEFSIPVENYGTIEVLRGHLALSRSGTEPDGHIHAGDTRISEGAQLRVVRGITIRDGASSSGDGTLVMAGSGGKRVEGDFDVERLQVSDDTLRIAGTLNIGKLLHWEDGVLDDSDVAGDLGIINLPPGTEFRIDGSGQKDAKDVTFNIGGTATFGGTADVATDRGVTFNVLEGALFDITNDELIRHGGTGTHVFNNSGTVRKSAGTGVSEIRYIFNNSGEVEVQSGTLVLREGGSSTGTFDLQADSRMVLRGNHTFDLPDGKSLTGGGTLEVAANTTVVQGPGVPSAALSYEISGGQLELGRTVNCQNVFLNGGVLNVQTGNSFNVANRFEIDGADIDGGGQVNLLSGSELEIIGPGEARFDRATLNIAGTATWTGSAGVAVNNGAVFNILTGGSFDLRNDEKMRYDNIGTRPQFNNAGLLSKSAGTGVSTIDVPILNTGGILVATGTLRAEDAFTQTAGQLRILAGATFQMGSSPCLLAGGRAFGHGTIDGDVINTGAKVAPGLSPDILTIDGDYTQSAAGTLEIEIGGPTPGTGFDQLVVTGTADIAGTLEFSLFGGFAPQPSDTFPLITAATFSGTFDSVTGTGIGDGLFFDPDFGPDGLTTSVQDGSPTITSDGLVFAGEQPGFQIRGIVGQTYIVESTSDFLAWTPVETRTLTTATWDFVDPAPQSPVPKFFRVRFLPD